MVINTTGRGAPKTGWAGWRNRAFAEAWLKTEYLGHRVTMAEVR
jgi:hypothetical protein